MTPRDPAPFGEQYLAYQTDRGWLRRFIRGFYVRHTLSYCRGRVLDFGCGAGGMLRHVPAGSQGLEINPAAVHFCRAQGLVVDPYDPVDDGYELRTILPGRFETLLLSHVLEHLDAPDHVLRCLIAACRRIGIGRVVVVVPGAAGFAMDATHKVFITRAYLADQGMLNIAGTQVTKVGYFPGNWRPIGDIFPHHEMKIIFDLT